jgi:hypothetical protein
MRHFTKNIRNLAVALFLTSVVALIGCGAAPDDGAPQEIRTALIAGGGGGVAASFTCDDTANTCTCIGDDDCNEMFGSGLCGPNASCDTSNPSRPVCTCTQAMTVVVKGRVPVVGIGKTTTLGLAR